MPSKAGQSRCLARMAAQQGAQPTKQQSLGLSEPWSYNRGSAHRIMGMFTALLRLQDGKRIQTPDLSYHLTLGGFHCFHCLARHQAGEVPRAALRGDGGRAGCFHPTGFPTAINHEDSGCLQGAAAQSRSAASRGSLGHQLPLTHTDNGQCP